MACAPVMVVLAMNIVWQCWKTYYDIQEFFGNLTTHWNSIGPPLELYWDLRNSISLAALETSSWFLR